MEYKNYYSKENSKLIKKYLIKKSFDKKWKGLLEEVFLRRTYELGLSKEQLEEDLQNFVSTIDEIRFAPEETFESQTVMGHCSYSNREICINEDYFKQLLSGGWIQNKDGKDVYRNPKSKEEVSQIIYAVFAHEVEHAAGARVNRNEYGLSYYDSTTKKRNGNALNEVFVETTANRCSMPRSVADIERYRAETSGYGDITFVSNILAATYGKTEKEILRAGSRGRSNLEYLLTENIPDKERALASFEFIEHNLNLLYNATYKEDGKELSENVIQSGLKEIYLGSIWELTQQIEETREISNMQTYISDIIYRRLKIEKIMEDAISKNIKYGRMSNNNADHIYEELEPYRLDLADRINDIDIIYRCRDNFNTHEEYERAIGHAMRGQIGEYSDWYKQNYGIDLIRDRGNPLENSITADLEYESYVFQEDFDNGKQWDNSAISSYILTKFEKELGFVRPKVKYSEKADTEVLEEITEQLETVDDQVTTELLETVKEKPVQKARRVISQFFTGLFNKKKLLNPGDAYTMQELYTDLATMRSEGTEERTEEQNEFDKRYKVIGKSTPVYNEKFNNHKKMEENENSR